MEKHLAKLEKMALAPTPMAAQDSLLCAAQRGEAEAVAWLPAIPGIDINKACGEDGDTLLGMAAFHGHTEVVRLLLAAPGIDVNKGDADGESPLSVAARNGHAEIVRLLSAVSAI